MIQLDERAYFWTGLVVQPPTRDWWRLGRKVTPTIPKQVTFCGKFWLETTSLSSRHSMWILHGCFTLFFGIDHMIIHFYRVVPVKLLRFQIIHSGRMPWSATLTRSVSQPFLACTFTLPKNNIGPEKWWLGNYVPSGKAHFQGWTVSFWRGIYRLRHHLSPTPSRTMVVDIWLALIDIYDNTTGITNRLEVKLCEKQKPLDALDC